MPGQEQKTNLINQLLRAETGAAHWIMRCHEISEQIVSTCVRRRQPLLNHPLNPTANHTRITLKRTLHPAPREMQETQHQSTSRPALIAPKGLHHLSGFICL